MDNDTPDELSCKENIDFVFEHRLFGIKGCVFQKTSDGETIALFVPMGDIMGAVPIHHLRREFEIPPGSRDEKLLHYAATALRYVRRVYPGDSIPADVISGRSPWMVEEKYVALARARVVLQVLAWKTGEDRSSLDSRDAIALAEDPETREIVSGACGEIADKLDLGDDGQRKVIEQLDRLGQELSYLEALRDKLKPIRRIHAALKTLYSAYRDEQAVREAIARCNSLLEGPIRELFDKFAALDANTGEIINTLKRFDAQLDYIRETRDELRQVHLKWEDLLARWESFRGVRDDRTEPLIRETYHFAARHFVQMAEW